MGLFLLATWLGMDSQTRNSKISPIWCLSNSWNRRMSNFAFDFFPKAAYSCLLGSIHTHRKIFSRNCWDAESTTWNFSGMFPSTTISGYFGPRGRVGVNGILFVSFKLTDPLLEPSLFQYKVIYHRRDENVAPKFFYSAVLKLDALRLVPKIQDGWTVHKYDTTACHVFQVCKVVLLFALLILAPNIIQGWSILLFSVSAHCSTSICIINNRL